MTEADRLAKWRKDTDDLYRAIGEFVVAFEHVRHTVEYGIAMLNGVTRAADLAPAIDFSKMQVKDLRTKLAESVAAKVSLDLVEQSIVDNALSRLTTLAVNRNDIIHSTWFIGWGHVGATDFTQAAGYKHGRGNQPKEFLRNAADFQTLTAECRALTGIFGRLLACVGFEYSIKKNFVVSDSGHVSLPPGTDPHEHLTKQLGIPSL